MKRYAKYIEATQSLRQLSDKLLELPSERKLFFNYLLYVTELAPNTLKMMLCSTSSVYIPADNIKKKLSEKLNVPVRALFPNNRNDEGSLASIYQSKSDKKVEYEELIADICSITHSHRSTVIRWINGRHYPRLYKRKRIAYLLGSSISTLFPARECKQ